MYQISYNHFKEVNINRYAKLDFFDIDYLSDFRLYCDKHLVVRYKGKYYIYNGLKDFTSPDKIPSFILVTKGKRTVYKITE